MMNSDEALKVHDCQETFRLELLCGRQLCPIRRSLRRFVWFLCLRRGVKFDIPPVIPGRRLGFEAADGIRPSTDFFLTVIFQVRSRRSLQIKASVPFLETFSRLLQEVSSLRLQWRNVSVSGFSLKLKSVRHQREQRPAAAEASIN